MSVQRLAYGLWTAFCLRCRRGRFQGGKDALFEWAVRHMQKHQKAALQ